MPVSGYSIAEKAAQYTGIPYVWGGNSLSSGVDCSGLTQQIYRMFGIELPRTTYEQIKVGSQVKMNELQAGDLVFFDTNTAVGGADHVGIYLGGGRMIHTPRPGKNSEIVDMTKGYYGDRFMGGRRNAGVQGGGQYNPDIQGGGVQAALSPEELAATYGWSYAFLNSQPEIKNLFSQAVAETWTTNQFKAKLQDTNWWKNTSEARRQAQILKATDPATYTAQVNAASTKARMTAAEMGAILPESKWGEIGEQFVLSGMTDEELKVVLAGYIDFTEQGTLGGKAGAIEGRLRSLAFNNGVQLSNQVIKNYAQNIAMGNSSLEQAEDFVRSQAVSMFPALAEQIEAGQNVWDIASPYITAMSNNLEVPVSNITLFDPKIKAALNGLDANGQPHGMSLTDFENQLRKGPEWLKTKNAREGLMNVGNSVLKNMGLVS